MVGDRDDFGEGGECRAVATVRAAWLAAGFVDRGFAGRFDSAVDEQIDLADEVRCRFGRAVARQRVARKRRGVFSQPVGVQPG